MCERLCWSTLLLLMHWNDALGRVPKPTWSSDSTDALQTTYLRGSETATTNRRCAISRKRSMLLKCG
jgi:hypothetical protein